MRFLISMAEEDHYTRWDASSEEEQEFFFKSLHAFAAAVRERGTIVAGEALQSPAAAHTIRGETVTRGPYEQTTELVGGFYLVELPDVDTAIEVAKLLRSPTVEVRPVLDVSSEAAGVGEPPTGATAR